jgi:polysaccharide pyruvyl transferase WcaK-like protein
MYNINIGLLTADLNGNNMGCNALTYSALLLLDEVSNMLGISSQYLIFGDMPTSSLKKYRNLANTQIKIVSPAITLKSKIKKILRKQTKEINEFYKSFDSCALLFEIAGGDSFSDIYGINRPRLFSQYHARAAKKGKNLVFLPQTIGPFATDEAKKIASKSLSYACHVFARDPISYSEAIEYAALNKVSKTIDMACFMDYERREKSTNKLRIGINPSGLLWNGGYKANNQFNLKTEYKKLLSYIVESLVDDKYEVVLVPHVLHGPSYHIEDDYVVCKRLQEKYPFCKVAPFFYTPVEAKSYISGLDLLVGSRMHCCIAAYSSGVPIYPLSYSRKFKGLFKEELNYPYGAELVSDDVGIVIAGLKNVLNNLSDIQAEMPNRLNRLSNYKAHLVNDLKTIITSCVPVHDVK